MESRKLVAGVLAVVLLGSVGGGIWYSHSEVQHSGQITAQSDAHQQIMVKGLIGSEKEDFFADPRVQAALKAQGLIVNVEKTGSRAIANRGNDQGYDFGFPSGAPAAKELQRRVKASTVFTPFYTPMVVASWRPIAEILVANGIATKKDQFYYIVDFPKLLKLINSGARWRDLKDSAAFATSKAVLINSTDVRTSNSAAMFLALASYEANGEQIVQSSQDVDRVIPEVAPLFLRQGFQEQSSSGPFEDYLALGMGKAPLLMAYESQMIAAWLKHPDLQKSDMVILYPEPTIYSKHIFVPYTPAGVRLGQLLETDPTLQSLAHDYGFRTAGNSKGPEIWQQKGIKVPDILVNVVDPPSYEWLEAMIKRIEASFNTANTAS